MTKLNTAYEKAVAHAKGSSRSVAWATMSASTSSGRLAKALYNDSQALRKEWL